MATRTSYWSVAPPPRTPEQDAADAFLFSFYAGKNRYVHLSDAAFSRWYLLLASFVILACLGAFMTMPIDYIISRFATVDYNVAYFTTVGVLALTAAILGPWIERQGPRAAVFLGTIVFFIGNIVCVISIHSESYAGGLIGFGVLGGFGIGLCFVAPVSAILKWFPDYRGMAAGFALGGYGAGATVWAKEYGSMYDTIGDSSMFLIFALAMCPVMLFCAVIVRAPPHDYTVNGLNTHGERVATVNAQDLEDPRADDPQHKSSATHARRLTLGSSVASLDFVFLFLVFFAAEVYAWVVSPVSLCYNDFTPVVSECVDFSTTNNALNCISTLLIPVISDVLIKVFKLEPSFGRKCLFVVILLVELIVIGILPGMIRNKDFGQFKNASYVVTVMYGGGLGLIPSFLADMFGVYKVSTMFGIVLITWLISSILGDYRIVFTGTAISTTRAVLVMVIVGFVLVFLVRTNPRDRFAGGYRFSICGCTIINLAPVDVPEAERTTVKDGETYAAMPTTPEVPTVPTGQDRPKKAAVEFPDAQALVQYRIPFNEITMGPMISQGGYGEVLRGTYKGQAVAVKRMLRKDPQSIHRFVKEIELTATLEHECVVRFIGAAWDEPTTLCMVSEFMYGGDLRTLLARYARTGYANGHDDNKLRIAVQVAHGIAYLHSLTPSVIHRDLKSKNVLLTAALDAKLIDFGVSREEQDETMTANVGTSLWMAPEVMLGKRYDEKADVFSFGVILSELDTHALPYDHARDTSTNERLSSMVLQQLITQGRLKPRFTDKAHPAMVELARDCLQLDPRQRPSAAELVYRINQCLLYEPTLTEQTRTAIDRSVLTVETRATTRYSPRDSFPTAPAQRMSMDTRESTRNGGFY